jgi:hypothetical protein
MLGSVLHLVGVDLERKIFELKAHLHGMIEDATDRVRQKLSDGLRESGIILICAFSGALAALATAGIGLAALFLWIDRDKGPLIALAAVGCATAVIAALMFTIAATRRKGTPSVNAPRPLRVPPIARPAPSPARPLDLSSVVPPPPANASPFDILTHRITYRAAAASDEAIEAAAELVRGGSRGTLIATLAVAGLVGIVIGRRTLRS